MEKVCGFTGEYDFLNNDYSCKIFCPEDGLTYTNVSAALIAHKSNDIGTRRKIARLSGAKARKKETLLYGNPDYEDKKDEILYHLLYIKFSTNNKLKEKLLNTKNKELLNIVSYPDTEYGIYLGNGNNTLGRMLMTLRSELSGSTTKKVVNKVINKVKSMI
jgi:predicted NAD-dependent protein-ADP-ribosyltransferase YbiA (DUF1768 family)